ncbi:MAG: carbohydrate binding domain-containing protein [Clostridia bacterium]|nr:carbohydrate binding domain-containing protein [Clostridia bacterium]
MRKISIVLTACFLLAFAQTAYAAETADYMPYMYEDFEDLTLGVADPGMTVSEPVEGGYGRSAGALRVTQNGNMRAVLFPIDMEMGRSYTISMKIKLLDDIMVNNGSFVMYFKSPDGSKTGYVQPAFSGVDFASKEWVEVSAGYTFDGRARVAGVGNIDVTGEGGTIELRIGDGNLQAITGGSSFSYLIDDVCVKPADLAPSQVPDRVDTPQPEPDPEEFLNKVVNGDFTAPLDGTWTPTNAEIFVSEDVPENSGFTNSLYVKETGNNGRYEQSIELKSGEMYKLSFWAKGIGAKDGVSVAGSEIVPRFTDEDGNTIRITDGSLVFAEEWTQYEKTFTAEGNYKAFHFITGTNGRNRTEYNITGISIKKVIPGDSGGEDDDEPLSYTTPEIRNVSVSGYLTVNQTIDITCEYLGQNDKTGLVQLFKKAEDGGWASIMRSEFTDVVSYTFKESDANQELKLLIVPMDTTGQTGGYREKELGLISSELSIVPCFTSGISGTVSADIYIGNYGNEANVVGILVLLDEDNTCVASAYVHSQTFFGETETVTVSAENPGNIAVKAKLYLWEGTSDINTTMVPLADSIEL